MKKRKVLPMRKILAALLAVMMIAGVFAALPMSAAEATVIETIDGTKNTTKLNDLIITEILVNSKSGTDRDDQTSGESAAVFSSPDALDYIEVYNAGTETVNIYDYCILSAPYRDFTGESKATGSNTAAIPYKFTYKNVLYSGDIHSTESGAKSDSRQTAYDNSCMNPPSGDIRPGETAVIWYWTTATDTACKDLGYSIGRTGENNRTFEYFRNYYGMDNDTKIFVTNAKASAAQNTQTGGDYWQSLEYNYVYALAKSSYKETEVAIKETKEQSGKVTKEFTSEGRKITCFAAYTQYNSVGIVNTQNMDGVSAYYVPSTCTPDLINQNNKTVVDLENEGKPEDQKTEFVPFADYVQAECAFSYRETAIISFTEDPTPGGMPSWQWQYLQQDSDATYDPENDSYGFGLAYIDAMVQARAEKLVETIVTTKAGDPLPNILGIANRETAGALTEAEQAAKVKEAYDTLLNAYVTDWLDGMGQPANTKIVDAETGRLNTKQTTAGTYDWVALADQYMKDYYGADVNKGGNYGYTESKKDYSAGFVNREEQYEKYFGNKTDLKKDEGMPIWALILIIVGGVLVVGAIVVVVIIVLKKKKPVAADDVASDGEIQVIDETAENTVEAPVEAPVEEENKPE